MSETSRGLRIAALWLEQIKNARAGVWPDPDETKRIVDDCYSDRPCPDCGIECNQAHDEGCDVARCLWTGGQRLQCEHWDPGHDCGQDLWDGVWGATAECVEFGWYCYFVPNLGFVPCRPDHPGATPDLNRIVVQCDWDREQQRWVKR